jgi:hypothetical protein
MVAKGWIEKQPDGRTYCITPAGDAALKATIPVKRRPREGPDAQSE